MSRRRKGDPVHGVVLLDKPAGLSSNQALQRVRRLFNARKAGHTGTLDPFATGMLPVCLGEATKTSAFMLDAHKAYRAAAQFGVATTTGDPEGEVIGECAVPELAAADIETALARFRGEIEQVPPMYSALKQDGRPLYELARQGIEVERPARRVTILELRLLSWNTPRLDFEVVCSKGTYVRTLGAEIAAALGTCAHLAELRRLWVAPFAEAGMVGLAQLEQAAGEGRLDDYLLPADAGLPHWPVVMLDAEQARRFALGNSVPVSGEASGEVRVHDLGGAVLGLARVEQAVLKPGRVFQPG